MNKAMLTMILTVLKILLSTFPSSRLHIFPHGKRERNIHWGLPDFPDLNLNFSRHPWFFAVKPCHAKSFAIC